MKPSHTKRSRRIERLRDVSDRLAQESERPQRDNARHRGQLSEQATRFAEPKRPPIAAHITEQRCHRRQCPDCGTITVAPIPNECVSQFGPQLTALIAYLTVVCRLPRLVVQRFLEGALQIPISLGSTQHAWEEASAAVAAPYTELAGALRHERVVNADETGHRT